LPPWDCAKLLAMTYLCVLPPLFRRASVVWKPRFQRFFW